MKENKEGGFVNLFFKVTVADCVYNVLHIHIYKNLHINKVV